MDFITSSLTCCDGPASAVAALHVMLRDGLIDLPDDERLLDELLTVRVVETRQGGLKVDTVAGRHDDQVDALGICAVELMSRSTARGDAGTVFSDMPPIQRHTAGNGSGAYNPLIADPWARARSRR
jgi:hypothetical protein